MNELLTKYDYKITYGKTKKTFSGVIKSWIGIITNYNRGDDDFGYRIGYLEKDDTFMINEVKDYSGDISGDRFYFVFPLLKLIEKSKKKKIKEILVSASTKDVDKALRPYFDVSIEEGRRKFILNEERLLMFVEIIKLVTYHSVVWEVKQISSNIMFRTKSDVFYLKWDERQNALLLAKKDKEDSWKDEKVMEINDENEFRKYLERIELVETFEPLLVEKTKAMYFQLTGKNSDDVEENELKSFYQEIERYMPINEIERQMGKQKMKDTTIGYRKTIKYYNFNSFIVGVVQTTYSDKHLIIEEKSEFQQMVYHYLNEELKKEVENMLIR